MEDLNDINELLNEANSYTEQKEFDKCVQLIEKNFDKVENNKELLKLYGLSLLNLENFDKSLEIFEKIIEMEKDDATCWFYLGTLYDLKNMLSEAQEAFEKVIELRDEYVDAYKNLAIVLIKQHDFEAAKEYAIKALALSDKDDCAIYNILATYEIHAQNYKKVIEYLEEALKYNPENIQILNNLGSAYMAIDKRGQALKYYEKALKLDTTNPITNYNLGCFMQFYDKYNKAFEHFEVAYQQSPTVVHLESLSYCLIKLEKWKDAVNMFKRLLTLEPTNLSYHENLAMAAQEVGDFECAITSLKILHNAMPANMSIVNKLVDVYLITNQFDKLKNFLARVIKRGKVATQLYYTYAIVCAKTGDYDTAVFIYKKVIQLDPTNAIAHKDLGVIYLMQKLFDWAEDEFKTALKLAPDNPNLVFELATFYYQIHKYKDAQPYYELALSLMPKDNNTITFAGLNYMQLHNIEKAKPLLEKSFKVSPDDHVVAFSLARIYFAEKKFETARQILYSLSTFSDDIEIINLMAQIHFELKEFTEACEIFKSMLTKNQDNINIIMNIAKCEIAQGNKDSALEYLNKYLEIVPESEEANELIWQIS